MNRIIYLTFIFALFAVPCLAQVKITPVKLKGEVVAYVESNFIAPAHSFIPNSDVLIVKVKRKKDTEAEYIKIKTEYFEEKSPLPQSIFNETGSWKFKLTRRVDCDSVLNPDYSELLKSTNDNQTGDVWTMDEPPKINFIRSEEMQKIPDDKVLPCYLILDLKKD